ncbi:MAG: hypothetical protein U1F66_10255 [bacterium]
MSNLVISAVEGIVDEAVVLRLFDELNIKAGTVYGKNGKPKLKERISAWNKAAQHQTWLVLTDLDNDQCAPTLISEWLSRPAKFMNLRVAVRSIEAWLLADKARIADFFRINKSTIPDEPDKLSNPKTKLIELIKRSRSTEIKADMLPRPEGGRQVGPAYSSRMIEFISDKHKGWRPSEAAKNSESLSRCINALKKN